MNRARPARQPAQRRVDREKTCPSLLRVFVKTGQHHADTDFTIQHVPSADEHQLYTWRDTTLREIINLVLDSSPRIRTLLIPSVSTSSSSTNAATPAPPAVHLHSPNARLSLRIVFFDPSLSRFTSTDLASFSVRDLVSSSNPPPVARGGGVPAHIKLERTLEDAKFVAGDLLDIAIIGVGPPDASAPTLVPPAGPGARGGPGSFGIRGAAGGAGAGANGFAPRGPAAAGGPGGGPGPKWALPGGPRGGLRGAVNARGPADQGWSVAPRGPAGGRRVSEGGGGGRYDDRDRPSGPPRRRSSRSRSPAARPPTAAGLDYDRPPHQRGRDRSRSPARRGRDDDVDMRD
ncbi:hypothetical protein NBRC10512_005925 [Rhodotorula toruloides]|uniref:RHTO0S02e01222g1_1 n=2 Tax=Rhodotorula toruloides TaxID=5286 RepID=A0A061AGW8_RHOTO|nr:histone deacetylase complex subunit SAP18 [Rhodotorula toruloides NP11]EMS22098.1 histone deacetylase complex subunit SAP18 [Rhodotorula toruloides NP11]KAJ8296214.1 Histone deacetylase complex subunit SAP18 [Rhodotorula toruloides]CDR36371.1 RHTO0S02e01222g1_1 [Rhodotorula toruloides]